MLTHEAAEEADTQDLCGFPEPPGMVVTPFQ